MSQVAIVTDSTADFLPGEVEKFGIKIVPLYVRFGIDEYLDGVTISSDEFYARTKKSPVLPQTTQPTPDDFLKAYKEMGTDKIVSIHISSKLSGTINSATRPQKEVLHDFDIRIIDSFSLSFGLGFLVIEAAKMAKRRDGLDTIESEVNRLIPKIRLYGILDDLHYLEKGGRIGAASALLGSLLRVKPIIKIKDGEVLPVGKVRTRSKALDWLVELIREEGEMKQLGVIHGAAEEEANILADKLKECYPDLNIPVVQTGPTLGTHSGPGLVGVCGLLK